MSKNTKKANSEYRLGAEQLQRLIDVLKEQGYEVHGPTVRDHAIVYDVIDRIEDLPAGWTDEQDRGVYRLKRREDKALFGYVVGPQSWKKYLFPPELRLWSAQRNGSGFHPNGKTLKPQNIAFLGVRACELHAITIQDKIFMQGEYVDPFYSAQRKKTFIVAVNCSQGGKNCFCVSMNTGPQVDSGYDLALTEVLEEDEHYFVLKVGSRRGQKIAEKLSLKNATQAEKVAAAKVVAQASTQMGKRLDTAGLKEMLYRNYENPEWEKVAERCLTCGNCTMVCPTCFCSTVEDVTNLVGSEAARIRKWDSCFTLDHSYIHGGSVRSTAMARYRQWLTHKLATWVDQFGTMGCVGCGRCITWCPVGIDITQQVKLIQREEKTEEVSQVAKEN